ncbi:hypothetical protein QCA50_003559 [Cerrena zonata]|uniref:FAD-binding domain-containing protein n=1 Tax=Cerrena zonata TaxID=2478898 RepID=A0AAW0GWM3_9APHY
MSPSHDSPLRIAICGGGIGGLALALILKRFAGAKPLAVDLYEAESDFTEIGAGITLWDRPRSIFYELGLEDELKPLIRDGGLVCRKSDTPQPFVFHELTARNGTLGLPRMDTVQLLLRALSSGPGPSDLISKHFSKCLESYTQDAAGVTLRFKDGSTASADVLVGADGIGSPTRRTMFTELAARARKTDAKQAEELEKLGMPTFTGTYMYRTLIDGNKLRAISPNNVSLKGSMVFTGLEKAAITYPISPSVVNVGLIWVQPEEFGQPRQTHSVTPASKQDVIDLVKGWEDDIQKVAEEDVTKWALSQVRLPQFVDGRVALLGDSAHAMLPHIGTGAGQAIEDAYILGQLLTQPSVTASNLSKVLEIYDTIRRPIAHQASDYVDVEKLKANDKEEFKKIGREMESIWGFHYANLPREDWARAKELFDKLQLD